MAEPYLCAINFIVLFYLTGFNRCLRNGIHQAVFPYLNMKYVYSLISLSLSLKLCIDRLRKIEETFSANVLTFSKADFTHSNQDQNNTVGVIPRNHQICSVAKWITTIFITVGHWDRYCNLNCNQNRDHLIRSFPHAIGCSLLAPLSWKSLKSWSSPSVYI